MIGQSSLHLYQILGCKVGPHNGPNAATMSNESSNGIDMVDIATDHMLLREFPDGRSNMRHLNGETHTICRIVKKIDPSGSPLDFVDVIRRLSDRVVIRDKGICKAHGIFFLPIVLGGWRISRDVKSGYYLKCLSLPTVIHDRISALIPVMGYGLNANRAAGGGWRRPL